MVSRLTQCTQNPPTIAMEEKILKRYPEIGNKMPAEIFTIVSSVTLRTLCLFLISCELVSVAWSTCYNNPFTCSEISHTDDWKISVSRTRESRPIRTIHAYFHGRLAIRTFNTNHSEALTEPALSVVEASQRMQSVNPVFGP
jgi:hypothetical protein